MKIVFIKDVGSYKVGDVLLDCEHLQAKAFIEFGKAKLYIATPSKPIINFASMSYKELRKMCKSKNIPAVGSRDSLIKSLTDNV